MGMDTVFTFALIDLTAISFPFKQMMVEIENRLSGERSWELERQQVRFLRWNLQ